MTSTPNVTKQVITLDPPLMVNRGSSNNEVIYQNANHKSGSVPHETMMPIGEEAKEDVSDDVLQKVAALTVNETTEEEDNRKRQNDENEKQPVLMRKGASCKFAASAAVDEIAMNTPQQGYSGVAAAAPSSAHFMEQQKNSSSSFTKTPKPLYTDNGRNCFRSSSFLIQNAPRLPASPELPDHMVGKEGSSHLLSSSPSIHDFATIARLHTGPPPMFSPLYRTTMVRIVPSRRATHTLLPLPSNNAHSGHELAMPFLPADSLLPDSATANDFGNQNNSGDDKCDQLSSADNSASDQSSLNGSLSEVDDISTNNNNKRRSDRAARPPPMPLMSPSTSEGGTSNNEEWRGTLRVLKMRRKAFGGDLLSPSQRGMVATFCAFTP